MKNQHCRLCLTVLLAGGLTLTPAMAQGQPSGRMATTSAQAYQAEKEISTAEVHKLSLKECMEYAVGNSTKMRVSEADREDEQALRRQAILKAFTPYVQGSTTGYEEFGRHEDPGTNTYTTESSLRNFYSVDARLTLFDGFKAINNIKVMDMSAKMGLSKEDQVRDEICLATMEAYCNALYYAELVKVLEKQVETAEASLLKAERQEEFGQKGYADVVQMRSELAQKEYQLTCNQNLYKDAMLTLKDVMYWPAEEDLLIEETLVQPMPTGESVEDIVAFAQQNQPSANIARLTLKSAETDLRTARWAYSPSVSLYGGLSTNYFTYPSDPTYTAAPFNSQLKSNLGEAIQLSLNIPIFDQWGRRTNISQKKNAVKRATAQLDQKMRDIENEVYRAVNDRDGAEAAFRQAERLAEVQEEAFSLNSRKFEQGLISSIEYHTVSETYLNACAERLGSLLKYRIKDSVVNYYNGISYIEQF